MLGDRITWGCLRGATRRLRGRGRRGGLRGSCRQSQPRSRQSLKARKCRVSIRQGGDKRLNRVLTELPLALEHVVVEPLALFVGSGDDLVKVLDKLLAPDPEGLGVVAADVFEILDDQVALGALVDGFENSSGRRAVTTWKEYRELVDSYR